MIFFGEFLTKMRDVFFNYVYEIFDKLKIKLKNINKQLPNFTALCFILHPVFILLAINNGMLSVGMGNTIGTIILGVIIGVFSLNIGLSIKPSWKSVAGVIFLLSPAIFFLESTTLNINLTWIIFSCFYLISGAILFARNNSDTTNKLEIAMLSVCIPLIIFFMLINFISIGGAYSPDSLSYYDMSKNIFKNFGYVSTVRQYVIFTDFGISFPYLFPMIIRIFHLFTGFGIFSGTVVNIIAAFISLYFILKISKKICDSSIPGLIAVFVWFSDKDYIYELFAARAVTLSIMCALLIVYIIVQSKKLTWKELFLIGLFAGAGMVIRFDFLVTAGLLGIALILFTKMKSFRLVPFYVLGLLVFTTPWILYSLIHFNKLWISDNMGTFFLIHPIIPQRYFVPGEIIPSMFSDFNQWFTVKQNILTNRIAGLFYIFTGQLEILMLIGIAILSVLSRIFYNNNDKEEKVAFLTMRRGSAFFTIRKRTILFNDNDKEESHFFKVVFLAVLIIYCIKTFMVFLVGYGDLRYHVEAIMLISLLILCGLCRLFRNSVVWISFVAIICFVNITAITAPNMRDKVMGNLQKPFLYTNVIEKGKYLLDVENVLSKDSGLPLNEIRLFIISGGVDPFVLGAHSEIKIFPYIANATKERMMYLMENYIKPHYIVLGEPETHWAWWALRDKYSLRKVSNSLPLYKVSDLEALPDGQVRLSSVTDNNWDLGIMRSSSILLFENSERNRQLLENASALNVGDVTITIVKVFPMGSYLHVECEPIDNIKVFSYPTIVNIIKK